jgi:multiple sugar transport system substrate-binding protein
MAVKPADRILFITALFALGIVAAVRLRPGKIEKPPSPPEPLRLTAAAAEEGGFGTEELRILTAGYVPESQEISVQIGAEDGEGEDIVLTEGRFLAEKIAAGFYLPLDKFERQPSRSSAVEKWVLPLVSSMDVLVYNIPLLRAAGFDRPPRTRGEFLRYARSLKAGGGAYPFALGLSPLDSRGIQRDIFSWIRASGLPLVRDGKPEFGGRRYTEALEFFSLLNGEELLAPGTFVSTGSDRIGQFTQGAAAMLIVSSRELREIRGKMGADAFGVTLVPQADDYIGKPVLGLSTWYAGIRADSPHPDEAWTLLRHFKSRSALLAEALALVPGTGIYEPYISLDPLLDKAWDMYEAADTVDEFLELPGTEELEGAFRAELEALLRRDSPQSPQDAAAAVRRFWEQWEGPESLR